MHVNVKQALSSFSHVHAFDLTNRVIQYKLTQKFTNKPRPARRIFPILPPFRSRTGDMNPTEQLYFFLETPTVLPLLPVVLVC